MEIRIYSLLTLIMCFVDHTKCKRISMKIVEEPTNYGLNLGGYQSQEEPSQLTARITPSNFSGPPHLKPLSTQCFDKVIESYKYEVCPFANITQHEQSLRWNPYSGVLGVWQEWVIENNTFVAMVMGEGDSCGSKYRKTKVLFVCGEDHIISQVTEPSTCNYEVVFKTPYACHPDSMLVYPTLPQELQHQWDIVEGQLQAETITRQGYNKLLNGIFQEAGYVLPESKKLQDAEAARTKEKNAGKAKEDTFESLYQCQIEYKKLQEEAEGLRTLLKINGISDDIPAAEQKKSENHEAPADYDHAHHYGDYQWMHDD